jgi:hypothetical protein
MKNNIIYLLAGGVIAYILFSKRKPVLIKEEPNDKDQKDDQVTGVADVIRESRNFDFTYAEERDAFYKQYDLQYAGDTIPQNGDLLVVNWKINGNNYFRRSTFQYLDRTWRRFANATRISDVKMGKPQRKQKQVSADIQTI